MRGDWEVGAVACCSLRLNARSGKGCTQQFAGRNAVTVNVNISPAISQALPLSHFKCAPLCTPSSTRTSTSGTNHSQDSFCLRILDPSTIPSPCWRPSSSPFARPRHLYLPLRGTGPTAAANNSPAWSIESSLISQFAISSSTPWIPILFSRFAF